MTFRILRRACHRAARLRLLDLLFDSR